MKVAVASLGGADFPVALHRGAVPDSDLEVAAPSGLCATASPFATGKGAFNSRNDRAQFLRRRTGAIRARGDGCPRFAVVQVELTFNPANEAHRGAIKEEPPPAYRRSECRFSPVCRFNPIIFAAPADPTHFVPERRSTTHARGAVKSPVAACRGRSWGRRCAGIDRCRSDR